MSDHREGTLAVQAQLVVAVAVGRPVVDALAEAKEAPDRPHWAPRVEAR